MHTHIHYRDIFLFYSRFERFTEICQVDEKYNIDGNYIHLFIQVFHRKNTAE